MKRILFLICIISLSCKEKQNDLNTQIKTEKEPTEQAIDSSSCDVIPPKISTVIDSLSVYEMHLKKPTRIQTYDLVEGQLVRVKGYFHDAKIHIESHHNGEEGYKVIRPFSYVREPNPSAGWPAWQAFDALLVNTGWVPKHCLEANADENESLSPYFKDPRTIEGVVKSLNKEHQSSEMPSEIVAKHYYDVHFLWEMILHQIRNSDLPPCGINYLPLYIEQTK